jgi:hypothetical protein
MPHSSVTAGRFQSNLKGAGSECDDSGRVVGYTEVIQDGAHADQYTGSRPVFRNSDRASTPGYRDPGALVGTNPADESTTSSLPVIGSEPPQFRQADFNDASRKPLLGWQKKGNAGSQFGDRLA